MIRMLFMSDSPKESAEADLYTGYEPGSTFGTCDICGVTLAGQPWIKSDCGVTFVFVHLGCESHNMDDSFRGMIPANHPYAKAFMATMTGEVTAVACTMLQLADVAGSHLAGEIADSIITAHS